MTIDSILALCVVSCFHDICTHQGRKATGLGHLDGETQRAGQLKAASLLPTSKSTATVGTSKLMMTPCMPLHLLLST